MVHIHCSSEINNKKIHCRFFLQFNFYLYCYFLPTWLSCLGCSSGITSSVIWCLPQVFSCSCQVENNLLHVRDIWLLWSRCPRCLLWHLDPGRYGQICYPKMWQIILCWATTQRSEDLNYIVAETWNPHTIYTDSYFSYHFYSCTGPLY